MIEAVGIDIADAERIRKALERWGDRFVARTFSEREAAYCRKHRDAALRYAARFAAKEAFLKALGCGLRHGISWIEIEVVNDPLGKPELCLTGAARERLTDQGGNRTHLSLSHDGGQAVAIVILE